MPKNGAETDDGRQGPQGTSHTVDDGVVDGRERHAGEDRDEHAGQNQRDKGLDARDKNENEQKDDREDQDGQQPAGAGISGVVEEELGKFGEDGGLIHVVGFLRCAMIAVYRGERDYIIEADGAQYQTSEFSLDALFRADEPETWLREQLETLPKAQQLLDVGAQAWAPPVESQEIWAAGVTYFRSREARMEEAEVAGGDVFYDKVYDADRPELFMKATAARARGHGAQIRVRADSTWDVPEPELTLAINAGGKVFGYTVGNDVSSRSIEGENPLYLPQAKCYRGSCAVGPALIVGRDAVNPETTIKLTIERGGEVGFEGETQVSQIKRGFDELAEFLFRENEFPDGALLMTGTGVVPDDFTLKSGDVVRIAISGVGVLENAVE